MAGRSFARPAPRPAEGFAGEFVHIGLLVVVQPQRAGEGGEHRRRRLHPPLFEPRQVVDADRGELRDLLAAKPGHAPRRGGFRQADIVRIQLRAARLEGVAEPSAHRWPP